MKRTTLLSVLLIAVLALAACSPNQTGPTENTPAPAMPTAQPTPTSEPVLPDTSAQTIVDIAASDGRFTTLVTAVQAAGLVETLESAGPFTVFAPTDEAFAALPAGVLEGLLAQPQQLGDILLYHVVPGKVMAADVAGLDGQMVDTALEGQRLNVSVMGEAVYLNETVQVIVTDIEAANGVIHVVDAVLLPAAEEAAAADIVDTAAADGRFTTLVTAVQAAGLVDTLKSAGPFTVFAPTDEAFAALPEGSLEALLGDIPQLTDILLYHVVPGQVMADDVVGLDGQEVETALEGQSLLISVENGNVFLNEDTQVIITDIQTSNGVIHVIDAVLLPGETPSMDIVETAIEDGRFTTLVAALEAAGLVETLQSEGPFTVFAPTDEAFAALPAGTLEALLQDLPRLTDILLYHVVEGKVMAADVVQLDGEQVSPILMNSFLRISVENGNVFLNDTVQVILTDIETTNGVIHVIDAVLLPE